jgi:probable addiction module antidote protein
MKKNKLRDFDELVVDILKESEQRAEQFLESALEEYKKDGDEAVLMMALRQVAIAKGGVKKLAKQSGLSRESLYKTLSSKGNPRLHTLKIILRTLGYDIFFKHIEA